MNERLSALVRELYADGVAHDAGQADRLLKRRNLEPATADLLGPIVRIGAARVNLGRAEAVQPGLSRRVELRQEDGGAYLAQLADTSIDLLFLDAERVEYPRWWPHPARALRKGGILAIDNVLSHANEVAPFLKLLSRGTLFLGTTVAVGKGLYLAWRGAV